MEFRRHRFSALLWVLIAGILSCSLAYNSTGISSEPQFQASQGFSRAMRLDQAGLQTADLHGFSSHNILVHASSGKNNPGEKRHKKTLISEAFVADFSLAPPPEFDYPLDFSLFLPGGCPRVPTGNYSLRGPPCMG